MRRAVLAVALAALALAGCGHATQRPPAIHAQATGRFAALGPFTPRDAANPVVGEILSTTNGTWTGSPTSFAYQWQHCTGGTCTNISAATASTYTIQSSDLGDTIDVIVTATNANGSASQASSATGTVTSGVAPASTAAPVFVSGTSLQGQTLAISTGAWTNTPTSYAYQWQDCTLSGASCVAITGATSASYTTQSSDLGSRLRAQVTASNAGGAGTPAVTLPTGSVATTQAAQKDCFTVTGSCGYPDPNYTSGSGQQVGVPPGTTLTNYTNVSQLPAGCNATDTGYIQINGTCTINDFNIPKEVDIDASNVTISNSIISLDAGCNVPALVGNDACGNWVSKVASGTGNRFDHVTFTNAAGVVAEFGVFDLGTSTICNACYLKENNAVGPPYGIPGAIDDFWHGDGAGADLESSWIPAALGFPSDHVENWYEGAGSFTINHSYMVNAMGDEAVVFMDLGAYSNVHIDNNLLAGGHATVELQKSGSTITASTMNNNRLARCVGAAGGPSGTCAGETFNAITGASGDGHGFFPAVGTVTSTNFSSGVSPTFTGNICDDNLTVLTTGGSC